MARKSTAMIALLLLIFLTGGALLASNPVMRQHVRVNPNDLPIVTSSQKVHQSKTHLMMSPGTVLDSTFYDYQRNGSMDDHLAIFDDAGTIKVNGSMMVAYLEDMSDRAQAYYHYDGSTWIGSHMNVFPVRNGYGSMSQFDDGRIAVAAHGNVDGAGNRCYAAYDAFPGIYAFSLFGSDPGPALLWPRISVNSDGSITMTGQDDATWDVSVVTGDEISGFGAWDLNFRDIAPEWNEGAGGMNWPSLHSGTNGMVGVAISDVALSMRLFESTDNGGTWDVTEVAPADTAGAPADLDSTAARGPWITCDLMYIGDEPHVVWPAGQVGNEGFGHYGIFDFKTELLHWSPSTGISTVTTAMYQSADAGRSDYVIPAYHHLSVDFPSLGLATDGTTLVCVWTSFDPADSDPTSMPPDYAYGDIWVAVSEDNGATWSAGKNVTNSNGTNTGWDDLYPALARTNINIGDDPANDIYMIYQTDDLAGTFVQGTEGSVNLDYIMFTGIDISDLTGIGDGKGGEVGLPRTTSLSQNYPNPFNPSTTVNYQVPARSMVTLKVYDVRGRLVQILVNEVKEAGNYSVQWNGKEISGQQVSSGIYLYTMETDTFKSTKKMVVLK